MSILSFFLSPQKPKKQNIVYDILSYTKHIVVRSDLTAHISIDPETPFTDEFDEIRHAIQSYLALEEIIIKHKPMIVPKIYTKQSLREEIRKTFPVDTLPTRMKLIFLPHHEQVFYLFFGYTSVLMEYIRSQIGQEKLSSHMSQFVAHTPLTSLDISTPSGESQAFRQFSGYPHDTLVSLFRTMHTAMFQYVSTSFGENTAGEITKKHYAIMKDLYEYDMIASYLQIVPHGQLEKEKVAYLTREDLEKRAIAAAEEKYQRDALEQSAKHLQEEKMMIEIKVQEQTAELKKEKDALQQANARMNESVLQAQKNEAKLLASVASLTLGFILTDTQQHIITINDAAKKIFTLQQPLHLVQELAVILGSSCNILSMVEESKIKQVTIEKKAVEWKHLILNIAISPIFLTDASKEYIGSAILITDITEEKLIERAKDDFFAIASHELRTPLTSIRGSVSILKQYYQEHIAEGDIPQLIKFIDQSSDRLLDIVNDFLNVSRLEQGRMVFKPESFSLSEMITHTVQELETLAQQKHVFLQYEIPAENLPNIHADKQKTKQIIVNLIGNAIKFTTNGGITITTHATPQYIITRVIDTGTGIAPENQSLLFRKFQQADQSIYTHDATKGTGLGLYICKKLVESMGGEIKLEHSELGKGSTFSFSLPIG